MRQVLFLLALVSGGCDAQRPASTPSAVRDVEPAATGVATGAVPKGQPPTSTPPVATPVAVPQVQPPTSMPPALPDGAAELGSMFPFVKLRTQTSFAHDHGDMTTIEQVEVAGKPCPPDDVLASIVAHWQGWTAAGGRSDEDVLRTTQAFVEAWNTNLEVKPLLDATAPDDLASILRRDVGLRRWPGGPPEGPQPAYHTPRYEIREDGGERVVLASFFVRGHISQRGQHWSYVVSAFRVKDGARYPIPPGSTLPRSRGFSEGD